MTKIKQISQDIIAENEIPTLKDEEKNAILKNAYTSFVHGVEHFIKYQEDEKNIKFAILHIFNTVELLVKGYLGSVNLNLLKTDIDKSKNIDKIADISVLLVRMKDFSEIRFNNELHEDIQSLRKKRNDIEHKKFISDDREDLPILCRIINGLIIFSYKHLHFDICSDLLTNIKEKFDAVRMNIDKDFAEAINKVEELKKRGFKIARCRFCLNDMVPYRRPSETQCLFCKKEHSIHECERKSCGKLFVYQGSGHGYPGECDECQKKAEEQYYIDTKDYVCADEPWDNLPKEKLE